MSNEDVVQAALNFAIGMERLLKGILCEINPTYVLVSPEFSHSLTVLYNNKIIDGDNNKSILAKTPTADVITFRNSLLRAAAISRAAQNNKNRLFGLSNIRDMIAHHDMEFLDLEKAKTLLQRDFYFVLLDFVDETNITRADCFGECEETLIKVSKKHQLAIDNVIRLKLEEHRKKWEAIKHDESIVHHQSELTEKLLESDHRYETACPACNQRAVLFSEPDYVFDTESLKNRVVGEFVRLIKCFFCELRVDDGLELDELGFGKSFHPSFSDPEDDIPF